MRDANRLHEKLVLSLDGRQVASITLVSLAALGAAFIAGLRVGRDLAHRPATAVALADPLAALDASPIHLDPARDEPTPNPTLSYHEELTKERPRLLEPVRRDPEPAPPPPPKISVSLETAPPPPKTAPEPPKVAPAEQPRITVPEPAPDPLGAALARVRAASSAVVSPEATGFTIQVGATQDGAEAKRLAERFRGHDPRVVSADLPGRGRWYRVRLGHFESREAATRYLRGLAAGTAAKAMVVSAR
jgi:cell division protein FtsN